MKWTQLEHRGPCFAPPSEPLPAGVRFYYSGENSPPRPEGPGAKEPPPHPVTGGPLGLLLPRRLSHLGALGELAHGSLGGLCTWGTVDLCSGSRLGSLQVCSPEVPGEITGPLCSSSCSLAPPRTLGVRSFQGLLGAGMHAARDGPGGVFQLTQLGSATLAFLLCPRGPALGTGPLGEGLSLWAPGCWSTLPVGSHIHFLTSN